MRDCVILYTYFFLFEANKGKGKAHPRTGHEGSEVDRG